ncbi:hypothetical protein NHQ30_010576 [Ciborinia camelliae]|nr:hypothetical protein NHQ30_010576 [Ciborinia camelliae]
MSRESSLSTPRSRLSRTRSPPQKKHHSPTTLMGRFVEDVQKDKKESEKYEAVAKGYISVSDSDSDDAAPVTHPISKSSSPVVASTDQISIVDDDEDAFSEEEFPELLAKARENKRLADLAQQRSNVEWANKNHEPERNAADDDVFQDNKQEVEPVLEIFISSRLEKTKNLVIRRKLHQRLREVRQAWCDKQDWNGERMPDELKDTILLTWRNKRLFDSMTCASLNLDFNTNGDLDSSGDGFNSGRIHMEAWTNDLWEEFCRAAEAEEISDDDESIEEVVPEPPTKMRLILKAQSKDIKEFKTYVKATTTIQKLVDGFRSTNKIPADKKIILSFDGDHLDLDSTVEDAGFEDMDTVEVLIR